MGVTIFSMIVSLFFVFNALGNIPLFLNLLAPFDAVQQKKIIFRELVIALFILLLFNFFGDIILKLMGISESALGVAGGTLLFIIAIGMIFPRQQQELPAEIERMEPMIVPLAIPLVAGPGSIAAVMIYAEQIPSYWMRTFIILAAWIPVLCIMLLSFKLKNLLGKRGLIACQRLGGMLLCMIAVNMVNRGIVEIIRSALYIQQ